MALNFVAKSNKLFKFRGEIKMKVQAIFKLDSIVSIQFELLNFGAQYCSKGIIIVTKKNTKLKVSHYYTRDVLR